MARSEARPLVKLRSTGGTGFTYVTRKNRRHDPDRMVLRKYDPRLRRHVVACHDHGTGLAGFLPASWDQLGCQLWDHPARLSGLSPICSLTRRVMWVDAEVEGGIQGGQRG